jgi:hypothetical protein
LSEELENLPAMHEARKNPDMEFMRNSVEIIDMPIFSKVVNREDVIFENAVPRVEEVLVNKRAVLP